MHTIFNIISVHLPESSLLRFFKNASGESRVWYCICYGHSKSWNYWL